jgi:PAS domain S-box-containing protein
MANKVDPVKIAGPGGLGPSAFAPEKLPPGLREGSIDRDSSGISVVDILDAVPFYVLLVDSEHNIIEANKAVYQQLAVKREDILGKYCPKVIHGLDRPFHGCPLEESAESNKAIEREIFDENTGRWVVSAVYPTRSLTRNGKRIFLHMVTDVTERKQAQEQLLASREQLRRLSAHLESIREEEKKKIARDLHDETSQVLASLHAHLEAAIGTLPEGESKTRDLLKKAQTLSTNILDDLHRLIYELRPAVIDELGLIAAINSMLDDNLKVDGLKVRFKTAGEVRRLSPALEITLFRVVQEAFSNVVKHSQASQVAIRVSFKRQSLKINIRDNGIGFDVQELINSKDKPRGLGLLGMRERVELANGSILIDSSPGQGTAIAIEVPLNNGVNHG